MAPPLEDEFFEELEVIRYLVEAEWFACRAFGAQSQAQKHNHKPLAQAMRSLKGYLVHSSDREALEISASAVESGWSEDILRDLSGREGSIAIVAGQLAPYGKQSSGLPSAFGCIADTSNISVVKMAMDAFDSIEPYLRRLHAHLRVGEVPTFRAANVFFMAGEGNRHPKRITYSLPGGEDVGRSPLKTTYYFTNTHHALLQNLSVPLASDYLNLGKPTFTSAADFGQIPVLATFAREIGQNVHRNATNLLELSEADRWAYTALQDVAANVFGILFVAELWAMHLDIALADVIEYHLAECLRYVDCGLGFFPDSDGMYLQLSYFVQVGALSIDTANGTRLSGDCETVLAALRSLARTLADIFLAGDSFRAIHFYHLYGPAGLGTLSPIVTALADRPQTSIEYN